MRYRQILVALENAGVRYVVAGGVAAALHGVPHEPHDLDLAVDRNPAEAERAIRVLTEHGFYPTIPLGLHEVTILRFLNGEGLEIDVFARSVVPFEEVFASAQRIDYDGVSVRVESLEHLIRAREATGTAADLRFAEKLRALVTPRPGATS